MTVGLVVVLSVSYVSNEYGNIISALHYHIFMLALDFIRIF